MPLNLPGYQINEKLHEGAKSVVYRARRKQDDQPMILKFLRGPHPIPEQIIRFKREYQVLRRLNRVEPKLSGVVTVYALENDQQQWAMALEDFGGTSLLQTGLMGQIELDPFLDMAIQLAEVLGQIHQQQIIHKDISPGNIVVAPVAESLDQWQVKLIDFGISTVLSAETPSFHAPNVLEGTLAYLSPEQTGRMNRAIDYRTDFYSLGATLYHLLTGQRPFPSDDPLELVHSHIALYPPPPTELVPTIPAPVSDIIMKLLAKNAEARYLTAYGLKADLEYCLEQWRAKGDIEAIRLGRYDISDRFQISQKLYGREVEIETLLTAFAQVLPSPETTSPLTGLASQARLEVALVSGQPGIGKSTLVQEIYKPITKQRGYFAVGKFDQLQHDTPYLAFIQAFGNLVAPH